MERRKLYIKWHFKYKCPDKLHELSKTESAEVQAYVNKTLSKNCTRMHKINNNCYAMGRLSPHPFTTEENEIVLSSGFSIGGDVYTFQKLMFHSTIYHCKQYIRKGQIRNNIICSYTLLGTQSIGFGEIIGFYVTGLAESTELAFSIINTFSVVHHL